MHGNYNANHNNKSFVQYDEDYDGVGYGGRRGGSSYRIQRYNPSNCGGNYEFDDGNNCIESNKKSRKHAPNVRYLNEQLQERCVERFNCICVNTPQDLNPTLYAINHHVTLDYSAIKRHQDALNTSKDHIQVGSMFKLE